MGSRKRHSYAENGPQNATKRTNQNRKNWKPEDQASTKKSNAPFGTIDVKQLFILGFLALSASYLHRKHISALFENDKHFSHLSNLERELSFRTEMGLYYSYYKTLIDAPSFLSGLGEITHDNVTEFPSIINTLQRFNLYPEVVCAGLYRVFTAVMASLKIETKQCWRTDRGQGLQPIISCEGLGDPMYFYTELVFLLNGAMMGVFFLFAYYLSDSYIGGIIAVLSYFYNHFECTRVQWTPALRESFAYPFLIVQLWVVSAMLRCRWCSWRHSLLLSVTTLAFLLPWQFSQFALATQVVAVTGVYVLDLVGTATFVAFLHGHVIALAASFIFLFGNKMLLSSMLASSLLSALVIVRMEPIAAKIKYRLLRGVSCVVVFTSLTVLLKAAITKLLSLEDDAHIGDILRSKFTNFQTFHTKLYTCAAEFDFLQLSVLTNLCWTLLLPMAFISTCIIIIHLCRYVVFGRSTDAVDQDIAERWTVDPDPAVVYNLLQLGAFSVMAAIIMRLKLFWTPQLCVLAALMAARKHLAWMQPFAHASVLCLIMALMSVQGLTNLNGQHAIKGEYSNVPLERLVEWIQNDTTPTSVFAGSMPTMATVKLTTRRPIVNHPHYEDVGLRARTKLVYSIYSRKPLNEVHAGLVQLKVDYVIVDRPWCTGNSKLGCSLVDIWDLEDNDNHGQPAACLRMKSAPKPFFNIVHSSESFTVFQVVKIKGNEQGRPSNQKKPIR